MPVIQHENKIHERACSIAESNRQAAVAAAGSSGAAVIAADVAFYRAVIVSCKANNLPFNEFSFALKTLGTGGQ
jgi:hypothetical protein